MKGVRRRKGAFMDEKPGINKSVIINSVDRSIDIIEYLFNQDKEASISQISKDLEIYKSTVYRTLATLENRGYVMQNPETGKYTLGYRLYVYGMNKKNFLVSSIMPYLLQLNEEFYETVTLSILMKDADGRYSVENIASVQSRHNLSANVDGTDQIECYCSSLGKCLLAFDRTVDLSSYCNAELKKWTVNTIDSYDRLLTEIQNVKSHGYAFDNEEYEIGLFCLGVPIMSGGTAVAAMSISGPASRIRDSQLEEKIDYMMDLSKRITDEVFRV